MSSARSNIAHKPPTTRSQISNGKRLLLNVDGRSSSARRFRDLVIAYEAELGGVLSEAERSLVRQAVALQLEAERMQGAIVRGEAIDSDALIRVSSTSKRLLEIISAKAAKRKAPSSSGLQAYLASKAGKAA